MYIYGKNVAKEVLNSNKKINKVLLSDKFKDREILEIISKRKIKTIYTTNNNLDKKVEFGALHQGIILDIDEVDTYELNEVLKDIDNKYPTFVMLDHLEDPHNFGAIIRTCEALGVDAIIIPNDRSVSITPTVVKTSAGAIYNTKIVRVPNLLACITKLKNEGFWIVGTDMVGEDYTKIDYKMPICLVIGNEGKGMSKIISDNCDFIASIPMKGKVNSLNASVSLAIVLAEIINFRRN